MAKHTKQPRVSIWVQLLIKNGCTPTLVRTGSDQDFSYFVSIHEIEKHISNTRVSIWVQLLIKKWVYILTPYFRMYPMDN